MAMPTEAAVQYFTEASPRSRIVLSDESRNVVLLEDFPEESFVFSGISDDTLKDLFKLIAELIVKGLHEMLLLVNLEKEYPEKLKVDIGALIELSVSGREHIYQYLRNLLPEFLKMPEVKHVKITAGIPEDGSSPHVVIIAKFKDSENAVDLSEELEYKLLSVDPKISNRILVYSLFE